MVMRFNPSVVGVPYCLLISVVLILRQLFPLNEKRPADKRLCVSMTSTHTPSSPAITT